jgi:hypothetical protein
VSALATDERDSPMAIGPVIKLDHPAAYIHPWRDFVGRGRSEKQGYRNLKAAAVARAGLHRLRCGEAGTSRSLPADRGCWGAAFPARSTSEEASGAP